MRDYKDQLKGAPRILEQVAAPQINPSFVLVHTYLKGVVCNAALKSQGAGMEFQVKGVANGCYPGKTSM